MENEVKKTNCEPCTYCDECEDEFFAFAEYVGASYVEMWNAKYGGSFVDREGEAVFIKQVKYQKPEVIVFWSDGTKSTAHCAAEDKYNFEMGLLVAVAERVWTKTYTDMLLKDWVPTTYNNDADADKNIYVVDITDVRKKYRAEEKAMRRADQADIQKSAKEYLESCGYIVTKK